MRKPIELIATCDGAYLAPLRSAMASCVINNPGERFCLHLLHSTVDEKSLLHMDAYCRYLGVDFCAHGIDRSLFDGAYASKRCITVFLRPMCLRRLRGGPCTLTRTCW